MRKNDYGKAAASLEPGGGEGIEALLITANLRCYRWLLFAVISRPDGQESQTSARKSGLWLFFSRIISEISEAYGLLKSRIS